MDSELNDQNTCPICYREYNEFNCKFPIHRINNGSFHYICITCFGKYNKKCPICRETPDYNISAEFNKNIFDACKNNCGELVLELLKNKNYKLINFIDEENNTCLIYACINKLEKVSLKLIDICLSRPEHKNNNNETALFIACKN